MKLSLEQRQQILSDGYTIIPGAIPRVMVEQALNAINADLGEGIDPEQVPIYRSRSFCPALQSSPVITDLFNKTPVLPLVESLLGEGQVRPVGGGQLAIRFPRIGDPPDRLGCHLDGMYSKLNGVKEGSISNFTMLAVVLLSDLTGPWQGNFTVWPGSHLKFEAWFREHGPNRCSTGCRRSIMPSRGSSRARPATWCCVTTRSPTRRGRTCRPTCGTRRSSGFTISNTARTAPRR